MRATLFCLLAFSVHICFHFCILYFFFFNAPATTELYTLSLHDALPIWRRWATRPFFPSRRTRSAGCSTTRAGWRAPLPFALTRDRKSTRLNSSHRTISYAVFCLKKKNKKQNK